MASAGRLNFFDFGLVYGINSQSELHGIAARPRMASVGRLYFFDFGLDYIPSYDGLRR